MAIKNSGGAVQKVGSYFLYCKTWLWMKSSLSKTTRDTTPRADCLNYRNTSGIIPEVMQKILKMKNVAIVQG